MALTEDREYIIDWNILAEYSAQELNSLSKLEQVELYMSANLIVLPTAYPIWKDGKLECSCWNGKNCPAPAKHPLIQYKNIHKYYEKKKPEILARFKNNPNTNIGFKVWGFSVIDLDFKNLRAEELNLLEDELGQIDTGLIATSGFGEHLYVSNTGVKNNVGIISGLDTRSCGGFIVAPTSLHKSGRNYEWKQVGEVGTLSDDWLLNIVFAERQREAKLAEVNEHLLKVDVPKEFSFDYEIPEGMRDMVLFKIACRERGRGAEEGELLEILDQINDGFCKPPMKPNEVAHIARWVARKYQTEAQKLFGGK